MHSSDSVFIDFAECLISLRLISLGQLVEVLDEFDGVVGVVENKLYISAYEEIARHLSQEISLGNMVGLLGSNTKHLCRLPEEQYCFVEAIIDWYSAQGLDVSVLIS